jgi:RNA polymerase sigma-70 factor (ECF subfamily)
LIYSDSTDSCNQSIPANDMPLETPANDVEASLKPLWLRAQLGDEVAYREALEKVAMLVRGFLRRRMQSMPDEVEDLVQETLLALHLQRGTFDPAVPVSAWVTAVARYKLVDLWRRRGKREHLHDALDDVEEALMVDETDDAGAQRDLDKLLQALPEVQRMAIVMTKIEGLSVAEASLRSGISESAIKVQVHRGLKRLALWVKSTR